MSAPKPTLDICGAGGSIVASNLPLRVGDQHLPALVKSDVEIARGVGLEPVRRQRRAAACNVVDPGEHRGGWRGCRCHRRRRRRCGSRRSPSSRASCRRERGRGRWRSAGRRRRSVGCRRPAAIEDLADDRGGLPGAGGRHEHAALVVRDKVVGTDECCPGIILGVDPAVSPVVETSTSVFSS